MDILNMFNEGRIVLGSKEIVVNQLPWNEHPTFSGVALKHLITGKDTDYKFSSHIVRIKAGCEIGNHIHEGKWELHEVIQGSGKCIISDQQISYSAGTIATIPADIPHRVQANEDLYLLAKFVPALL